MNDIAGPLEGRLKVRIAKVFLPHLNHARYHGLKGGRGAAKSHFVAERAITECITRHQRVACLREYQSSLAESSKRLLEDKIKLYELDDLFAITESEIRGPNDSLLVFKGLQGARAHTIRSLEGFGMAIVEEAQAISQNSIESMTPTFRRTPGMDLDPEMWFIWNAIAPDDPVEKLFKDHEPEDPDFILTQSTYRDNPWFPEDLRRDMERDRRRDHDKYAHVWLGAYQRMSQAAVFRNWRIQEFETPSDARLFFGADWGFGDPTVLVRCWIRGHALLVDYEAYAVGCPIDQLPALFDTVPGSRDWPIRGDSARPETIDYLKARGFNIRGSVKGKGSVEDGVEFLKSYDIIVHPRCVHTGDEMALYSYQVNQRTNEVLPILAEKENHVIDALRYALEGERLGPKQFVITPEILARARSPHRNAIEIPPPRRYF